MAKKVLADGSQSPKYLPMTVVELVWKKRGKENKIQKYDKMIFWHQPPCTMYKLAIKSWI